MLDQAQITLITAEYAYECIAPGCRVPELEGTLEWSATHVLEMARKFRKEYLDEINRLWRALDGGDRVRS
jgi:hypothetical protein